MIIFVGRMFLPPHVQRFASVCLVSLISIVENLAVQCIKCHQESVSVSVCECVCDSESVHVIFLVTLKTCLLLYCLFTKQ